LTIFLNIICRKWYHYIYYTKYWGERTSFKSGGWTQKYRSGSSFCCAFMYVY